MFRPCSWSAWCEVHGAPGCWRVSRVAPIGQTVGRGIGSDRSSACHQRMHLSEDVDNVARIVVEDAEGGDGGVASDVGETAVDGVYQCLPVGGRDRAGGRHRLTGW